MANVVVLWVQSCGSGVAISAFLSWAAIASFLVSVRSIQIYGGVTSIQIQTSADVRSIQNQNSVDVISIQTSGDIATRSLDAAIANQD